jgi:hypothetical protein
MEILLSHLCSWPIIHDVLEPAFRTAFRLGPSSLFGERVMQYIPSDKLKLPNCSGDPATEPIRPSRKRSSKALCVRLFQGSSVHVQLSRRFN